MNQQDKALAAAREYALNESENTDAALFSELQAAYLKGVQWAREHEVGPLRDLLKEWFDDDYDGAELLIRTGEALKSSENNTLAESMNSIPHLGIHTCHENCERLREALEKIANGRAWVHCSPDCVVVHAREVLKASEVK